MTSNSDPKYDKIGEILKYFSRAPDPGTQEKPVSQLTALAYGQILLGSDFLQDKLKGQKNFLISHAFTRPDEELFVFQEFLVNQGLTEFSDEDGRKGYEYGHIISKLQDFYNEAQRYFQDPAQDVLNRNYYLLEYHLLHHLYIDPETKNKYLILFAPVGGRETLNSRIQRFPTLKPNPGQVLTLIKQISGVLRFLFIESNIYYGDEHNLPLLEWSPDVSLTDIWFFGKLEYKLNLLSFVLSEQLGASIYSHKVKDEIEKLVSTYKGINSKFKEEDKKKLYHISLNSLAVSAARFIMNNVNYMATNPKPKNKDDKDYSKDIDMKEVEKSLETNFINEFKEEGELLGYVLKEIFKISQKDQAKSIFLYKTCLEGCKGYNKTDPKQITLTRSFERQGMTRSKRSKEIQDLMLAPGAKRETELDFLKDLVNRDLGKEKYNSIYGNEKKDSNKTVKTKDQPKNVVYPYVEVEYPLSPQDISNISPNSNDEKLICQVYPLFEKDFFVYRALTTQLVVSIEFNDDLILLLGALSEDLGYINAEIDNDRRLVLRSALNLQPFENEFESHINAIDHLAIVALLIIRKLNFCIEQEEFGRMAKNTKLIIEEIKYHLQVYREQNAESKSEVDDF